MCLLTSQEQVAPALSIEGTQGEADEDDGGAQEGGYNDATQRKRETIQFALCLVSKWTHPTSTSVVLSITLVIHLMEKMDFGMSSIHS